ncbi:MAG: NFACT RNA binding domain-containing protein [Desulfovibrio sp.]|nr:NFACT RNA binding domain-containing protein [Desulfovibrio sp.]
MDAHLFSRFCGALTPLIQGARLEKIQEPFPDVLTFRLFSAGRTAQLCWRYGKSDAFCFLTAGRISANNAPSARVLRLRKYAAGKRIRASVMHFHERRLWLLLARSASRDCAAGAVGNPPVWLCLDLRCGASLHFLTADAAPEEEILRWPALDNLAEACAAWRQWPVLTPALRRTLAHLDEREGAALLVDLMEGSGNVFVYRKPGEQAVCIASAWPLPPALRGVAEEERSGEVLDLLEKAGQGLVLLHFAEQRMKAERHAFDRQVRKLERLRQRLREEEIRLVAMAGAQADALALRENLWRLPPETRGGGVAVPAGEHGPAREIRLAPSRTVRQEMEALFHTAKRGQRGLAHLARRRAVLEEETDAPGGTRRAFLSPEAIPGKSADQKSISSAVMPKNLPGSVRAFVSDDGFVLLRGRDAKGNLAARKLAAPHDIWLHAENGPGAHVIIRRSHAGQEIPEQTLVQAGILAACKSWAAEAGKARVIYAEARHVKTPRASPAGTVRVDRTYCSRHVVIDDTLEDRLALDVRPGEAPGGPDQGRSTGNGPTAFSSRLLNWAVVNLCSCVPVYSRAKLALTAPSLAASGIGRPRTRPLTRPAR